MRHATNTPSTPQVVISKRVLLLAGAPGISDIESDPSTHLDYFLPAFDLVLHGSSSAVPPVLSADFSAWRKVPLPNSACRPREVSKGRDYHECALRKRQRKQTGLTNPDRKPGEDDFLAHSFALSEEITTTLEITTVPEPELQDDGTTSFLSSFSALTEQGSQAWSHVDSGNDDQAECERLRQALSSVSVQDIRAVPNAKEIVDLYPQTVTPNFLVGVIAVSGPSTVCIRAKRQGDTDRFMDIVKLVVGDDTAAPFTITFWLPSPSSPSREGKKHHAAEDLGLLWAQLAELKRGDVLLLTNVALYTYQGEVYGQSLRRKAGAVSTRVMKISQATECGPRDERGVVKLQRVVNWVTDFVGTELGVSDFSRPPYKRHQTVTRFARGRYEEKLPPDTQ